MELSSMKKTVLIIMCIIVFIGGGIMIWNKMKSSDQIEFTVSEKTKMIEYFHENYQMFSDIKDYLWPSKFDYATVNCDGEIQSNDITLETTEKFRGYIKKFYSSQFPRPEIGCSEILDQKSIEFLFYYDSNRMIVGYVYSKADLSNDSFYSKIADNWYLQIQGMV